MGKPERRALRLDGAALSAEGRLFDYLNHDPIIGSREAALRALRAFYLPWAMAEHLNEEALKALARTAVQELQFRVFQIQQQFLMEETIAPFPGNSSAAIATSACDSPTIEEQAIVTTVEQMWQGIDSEKLSRVLDDF